jgi:hypothetical protein
VVGDEWRRRVVRSVRVEGRLKSMVVVLSEMEGVRFVAWRCNCNGKRK